MKKIASIFLFATAAACLAGCNSPSSNLADLEGQKFSIAHFYTSSSVVKSSDISGMEFVKKDDGSTYFALDFGERYEYSYSSVAKKSVKKEKTIDQKKEVPVDCGSYFVKDEKHTASKYVKSLTISIVGEKFYEVDGTLSHDSSEYYFNAVCYQELDQVYNISFDTLISQKYTVISSTSSGTYLLPNTDVHEIKFEVFDEARNIYSLVFSTNGYPDDYSSAIKYRLYKERYESELTKDNMSIIESRGDDLGVFVNISDKGFGYFSAYKDRITEVRYFSVVS